MEKKILVGLFAFWLMISFVSVNTTSVANNICTEAIPKLLSCLPFLITTAPAPSLQCCEAVGWASQHATTTQDRRDLCKCLKSAVQAYKVDPDRAKQLPGLCKVPVPVPIVPTIDCNKGDACISAFNYEAQKLINHLGLSSHHKVKEAESQRLDTMKQLWTKQTIIELAKTHEKHIKRNQKAEEGYEQQTNKLITFEKEVACKNHEITNTQAHASKDTDEQNTYCLVEQPE
ncbi:unnamed protein product [Dovyalis caffra]|uniref:Bifunctional inhibitor/plant lipid transfer protein/seed storage helical domain-containing protein n=1 Tax=Dovyalis caffra TaxID=77055 RepID=A0AAV1SLS0_9ROSI|nr:unnamed protein product [Dovyalis caffra]